MMTFEENEWIEQQWFERYKGPDAVIRIERPLTKVQIEAFRQAWLEMNNVGYKAPAIEPE